MGARGAALLRFVFSLVGTFALVVGVPVLLVQLVGNPLPDTVPTVEEVRILLTQTGDGFANLIIGALAVLIWCIWAQVVVALIVEVIAVVRQTETRRLPTLPGVQRMAAGLIAAITLAASLTVAPSMTSAVGALNFDDLPGVQPTALQYDREPAGDVVLDLTVPVESGPVVSFQAHDEVELWDIAETAYGDGLSWRHIAALNLGRVDSTGATITSETATVGPGTVLQLSGDVDELALRRHGTVAGARGPEAAQAHTVVSGDSMWTVAQKRVEAELERPATDNEVAEYWSEIVEANRDVPSGDADLIFPGDDLSLPSLSLVSDQPTEERVETPESTTEPTTEAATETVAEEAIEEEGLGPVPDGPSDNRNQLVTESVVAVEAYETVAEETVVLADGRAELGSAQPDGVDDVEDSQIYRAVGLAGFGWAVLAAGVVGALRRRRDRQRRTRPAASIANRPSSTAAAFEAAMRQSSSQVRQSDLGSGWQALPVAAVEAARAAGSLQFHAEESGRLRAVAIVEDQEISDIQHVEIVADEASDATSSELAVRSTLLVGTDCTSGEAVFLDLDSSACVSIQGTMAEVQRFARTAVLDLAVSDRTEDLLVLAVGVAGQLADLERVHVVDNLADALQIANRSGCAVPGSSTPIIVVSIVGPDSDTDSFEALRELGACVVAPGIDTLAQVRIDGAIATLEPHGTRVELAVLADADYASVVELIDTTTASAMVRGELPPAPSVEIDPGPVEVQVLGPVQVIGAQSFSSLKAVDVVAYLAFHRNGADADQIKSWVWPAYEPPTDKAFANVMSRARRGLGAEDDGSPYLSRAGADRTYRLSPAVTTDFDRFRAIVEQADQAADSAETLAILCQALELIRGVPFTGGGASSFVWADNHVRAQLEFAIDEATHRCADLALEVGDLDTARWAALKGLELVPGCEQCFRRRFLVARAGENRRELRRAMADLERSAAVDLGEPEAVDLISGDLLDLYHQLDQQLLAGSS